MPTRVEDFATPQSIVNAVYETISGKAGETRDWERLRSLYAPGARLIPFEADSNGRAVPRIMTPDEWIEARTPFFASEDFFEWETERREDRSGTMAHVWSGYEAARTLHGAPIRCGVNSVQLWHDGQRWWILSVAWDGVAAKAAAEG